MRIAIGADHAGFRLKQQLAYSGKQGVEDDDMNVLVMGARVIEADTARELLRIFLQAAFSGADRHMRRLSTVRALEARYGGEESTLRTIRNRK